MSCPPKVGSQLLRLWPFLLPYLSGEGGGFTICTKGLTPDEI